MQSIAPETRADYADRRLRDAILTGVLAPGEKLVAAVLAQRYDVSPTPLREAIQRLAADGLVSQEPQRGARVALASPTDMAEIYELRLLLEPKALRDSLERSDDAHRTEIDGAYERLVAAARSANLSEFVEEHAAFHDTLVSRCPSGWLRRFVRLLADHSQRYAVLSVRSGGHHDVLGEHQALRDAARSGQVDQAVAELDAHLRRTLHALSTPAPQSAATGATTGV